MSKAGERRSIRDRNTLQLNGSRGDNSTCLQEFQHRFGNFHILEVFDGWWNIFAVHKNMELLA